MVFSIHSLLWLFRQLLLVFSWKFRVYNQTLLVVLLRFENNIEFKQIGPSWHHDSYDHLSELSFPNYKKNNDDLSVMLTAWSSPSMFHAQSVQTEVNFPLM
jgi:hypothetical protein